MSSAERRRAARGFANPEPLLLLCVIGILLAIAIPRFVYARERRANLAQLAQLRAQVAAYEGAHAGAPPPALQDASGGAVPQPKLRQYGHPGYDAGAVGPDTGV